MKISEEIKQVKPFRNENQKASVNLIFTGKWLFNLHNEFFKAYGLSVQQYNILKILNGQYPKSATVKTIRERMLDKMSDASRIVENLRKKEFITRELKADNRREVDVLITQKGIDLLKIIEEKDSKTLDGFLSKLSQNEKEQLNALLDKLRG